MAQRRSGNDNPEDRSRPVQKSYPLDDFPTNNPAIQEVKEMLKVFVQDERLMELYRQEEERMRVERMEANKYKKMEKQCKQLKRAREAEQQKNAELLRRSILSLKAAGRSNAEIAELLEIPLTQVESAAGPTVQSGAD